MSEYQYYEFSAIDRPLSAREMNELRSYSTRAHITPTSFVNDYSWGSFKGDEHAWMEKNGRIAPRGSGVLRDGEKTHRGRGACPGEGSVRTRSGDGQG